MFLSIYNPQMSIFECFNPASVPWHAYRLSATQATTDRKNIESIAPFPKGSWVPPCEKQTKHKTQIRHIKKT